MARDPDARREEIYPGPPFRVREGDHLWYIPPTGERFLSVTSALETRAKEDLDHRWRPRLTAKAAFNRLPELVTASRTKECGQTYGPCSRRNTLTHDWRDRCPSCPCERCIACLIKDLANEHYRESTRATDRGSAYHHWAEQWVLNAGDVAVVWDIWRVRCGKPTVAAVAEWERQIRPYTESFLRFVDDFGLTSESWLMAEATVLNRTHGWGGTLDGRIQFHHDASKLALELCERLGHPHPIVSFDSKTREKAESAFWDDNALQLAAYRRGEVVLLPDGTEEPLGPDDGALIVQVRPDGYGWRIPVTDDKAYAAFLGVLVGARWTIEHGNESVLVRAHPRVPLPGVEYPEPPKKRAPRKATVAPADGPASVKAPVKRAAKTVAQPTQPPPRRSAVLESLERWPKPAPDPHPDSLYQDEVPF